MWILTIINTAAMNTINDLIQELQKLNPQQKKLPFVLYDTEHNQEFNLIGLDVSDESRIELNVM